MKKTLIIACMLNACLVNGDTNDKLYLWFNGYRDGEKCPDVIASFEENNLSLTSCAKRCEVDQECPAFFYSETENICQGSTMLFGTNVNGLPTMPNSKYYFETPTWQHFNGSWYLLHKARANCVLAQDLCVKHGGHLVNVGSSEENDFLTDLVTLSEYGIALIGLNGVSGTWKWFDTDQTPAFTAWDQADTGEVKKCVYLREGTWHSTLDSMYSFVCEKN